MEVGDGELGHRATEQVRGRYPARTQHHGNLVGGHPAQSRECGRGLTRAVICLPGGIAAGHGMNLPRVPGLTTAEVKPPGAWSTAMVRESINSLALGATITAPVRIWWASSCRHPDYSWSGDYRDAVTRVTYPFDSRVLLAT